MNLLQKALGYIARSIGLTDPRLVQAAGGRTTTTGELVSTSSVLGLASAWACVNLLAGTIASLPLMVYRTRGGARTVASDHPLYRILHDSPNADQTAVDFWEFICASIELSGNAYAEIIRGSNGRVVALSVPIAPELMTVRRLRDGSLEYEWYDNGVRSIVQQDNMLHIRGFGGNPLGGLSTLSFGRQTFGLAQAIERASGDTFRNGVRPSGLLKTADSLTLDQRKQAEELLQEKFAGAINAGRPMLLDRGMDWVQLSISPEDAQMLQSRAFSVEEVCRFFGVPPFMVGHTEKTTSWGTGLEQQTLGFQKFTLRRRLKRIEQALAKQLLSPADRQAGLVIEFNLEGLLRNDGSEKVLLEPGSEPRQRLMKLCTLHVTYTLTESDRVALQSFAHYLYNPDLLSRQSSWYHWIAGHYAALLGAIRPELDETTRQARALAILSMSIGAWITVGKSRPAWPGLADQDAKTALLDAIENLISD